MRSLRSGALPDDATAFHDHPEVLLGISEKPDVFQRVASHGDEVRSETGLDLSQLAFHADKPRSDNSDAAKQVRRRDKVSAQLKFLGLPAMQSADEIGAVGHWNPEAMRLLHDTHPALRHIAEFSDEIGGKPVGNAMNSLF
jgi:hypothetical protein